MEWQIQSNLFRDLEHRGFGDKYRCQEYRNRKLLVQISVPQLPQD